MSEQPTESFIKRALRDPLVHFLILGGLLFVTVSWWGTSTKPQNEIVISQANQLHITDLFELTWQRKPTADELKNLIEEHIKEEVYYREALALGLDENDTIVRRRLRQKLEFMQEDLSSLVEPSEAELRAYYVANRENYKTEHIISLKQVILSSRRLEHGSEEIPQALQKLNSGETPREISQSTLLPISMNMETDKSIGNMFGWYFVEKLPLYEIGTWVGPIYSGFGTHLVNVSLNQPAKLLTYEQAKNKVSIDFIRSQREQAAENYYKNLRSQYNITIEQSE